MRKLKSESEIINNWQPSKNPIVSINCITYNHENYIEDAIRGFLMQETNFPFEILIHDDASTDNTQKIIHKYESEYPNIIKAIYQTKNQYSKLKKISTLNYKRAKGKYFALCEGDDFWIDSKKLQKQVEILGNNSNVMLCVHATKVFNMSKYDDGFRNTIRLDNKNRVYEAEDIILGGGFFGHTSSYMFRSEIIRNLPNFFYEAPVGDLPITLLCAAKGKMYYIDQEMSVYRRGVKGSWTERMKDPIERIIHASRSIQMYKAFDRYTNYKYTQAINKRVIWYVKEVQTKISEYSKMLNVNYDDY